MSRFSSKWELYTITITKANKKTMKMIIMIVPCYLSVYPCSSSKKVKTGFHS